MVLLSAQMEHVFVPRIALPTALSLILANLDKFEAHLDEGRIVIAPKTGVKITPVASLPDSASPLEGKPKPILRPKFFYRVVDRALTPELAKRMGFSDQRLKVYLTIYGAKDARGIQAKDVMDSTGLPHGTVQQILHWLRKQKLVVGEPEG